MNLDKDYHINNAEIISVGTELLLGQIINTNAYFFAQELSKIGIDSYYQQVVGDNKLRLLNSINLAMQRSDLVLITGGLGPTKDDMTMEVAAEASNNELKINEVEKKKLINYFNQHSLEFTENNLKQVLLPTSGIILPNDIGTAPGSIMKNNNSDMKPSLIALLPGPPKENSYMYNKYLKPLLLKHTEYTIENIYIRTIGISESKAAALLDDYLENSINPSIASYAFEDELIFRLSYKYRRNNSESKIEFNNFSNKIIDILQDYIFEIGERPLKEIIYDLLKENNKTIAFAESCTLGYASFNLANQAGSSEFFKGGCIVYDSNSKENVLQIPNSLIKKEGTICANVAKHLAKNVRNLYDSDYGIGITGNAGPRAIENKCVGLVYIGFASKNNLIVKQYNFTGDRLSIIKKASQSAYNLLRECLIKELNDIK